ncbi:MAG: flavin reductase [Epulopiscium sp. Nele67-Bin004]|nr:MAG: flavin reductase [Epulopiscium sp. Nele67-Bin004]
MKEVMYNEYAKEALTGLQKGAFLNVRNGEEDNTMTIAWGSLGFIWRKPVLMVMVRYSRHTYEMIEKSGEFTVSIPIDAELKKAIGLCGSLSGANVDKWSEANITKEEAQTINAPIVGECELHYECKVVCRMPLEEEMIDPSLVESCYKNGNYHVLYYGEILKTYIKQKGE